MQVKPSGSSGTTNSLRDRAAVALYASIPGDTPANASLAARNLNRGSDDVFVPTPKRDPVSG